MIFLNNSASTFPKPQSVIDAVNSWLIHPHNVRTGTDVEPEDFVNSCRNRLAKLFNVASPERIVFTSGSTESLNLVIKSYLVQGSHAVATLTEHNSVIRPLKTLEAELGVTHDLVDCDEYGFVNPEDIQKAIKPNTKLIILNFCSNVTGTIQDVAAISAIARKNHIPLLVDASQAAGTVDIDVQALNIDLMAFTAHKSLYGIPGSGGLYISPELNPKPLKTGGTGTLSSILTQPDELPMKYESGTQNYPGICALNAGLAWVEEIGLDVIKNHKKALLNKIYSAFENESKIKIYKHPTRNSYTNFCFNIGEMAPEEVQYMLESSFDIKTRSGLHCAPLIHKALGTYPWGTVRVSPSYFTTEEEIDKLIEALKGIIKDFA